MALTTQRYPYTRVLLPRTRLAYVHLRNLLTDAKRDRSARVSGYVIVWLPEETLTLFLRGGEVINATARDGTGSRAIAIARALEHVPAEPEYGEVCFHEADEAALACMFRTQTSATLPWPAGLAAADASVLFPYLMATTFDGILEILAEQGVHYLVFHDGRVANAFLANATSGSMVERVTALFAGDGSTSGVRVSRWALDPTLPAQAPPALVQAYRELAAGLVQHLVAHGRTSAPAIAEHARQNLLATHPVLDGFSFSGRPGPDPVTDTDVLTGGVAAWIRDFVWAAADHDTVAPDTLLRDLTWDRRHVFQAAGLYDQIPWKVL